MFRTELLELLHHGLIEMGQPLDQQTEAQLIRYVDLIAQWNRVYKLTSL
jgi:16S rRNA G527 N7-methylase RsmG